VGSPLVSEDASLFPIVFATACCARVENGGGVTDYIGDRDCGPPNSAFPLLEKRPAPRAQALRGRILKKQMV